MILILLTLILINGTFSMLLMVLLKKQDLLGTILLDLVLNTNLWQELLITHQLTTNSLLVNLSITNTSLVLFGELQLILVLVHIEKVTLKQLLTLLLLVIFNALFSSLVVLTLVLLLIPAITYPTSMLEPSDLSGSPTNILLQFMTTITMLVRKYPITNLSNALVNSTGLCWLTKMPLLLLMMTEVLKETSRKITKDIEWSRKPYDVDK